MFFHDLLYYDLDRCSLPPHINQTCDVIIHVNSGHVGPRMILQCRAFILIVFKSVLHPSAHSYIISKYVLMFTGIT